MNRATTSLILVLLLAGCNSQAATPDWCDASKSAAKADSNAITRSTIHVRQSPIPVLERTKETNKESIKAILSAARETNNPADLDVAQAKIDLLIEQQKLVNTEILFAIAGIKRGDKSEMAVMCKDAQKLFGVGDVAYTPLAGMLYLNLRGREDKLGLNRLGTNICRLRKSNDGEFIVHVAGIAEWAKLKSTSQLPHLKDDYFIACEGNGLGGVYDNPLSSFSSLSTFRTDSR